MAVGVLITSDEVKELNSISGSTDYDYQINALIPIVTEFIWKYCNLAIAQDDTYDLYDYPIGLKLPAAQMIYWQIQNQNHNVASERVGNYSVSFTTDSGIPKPILIGLKPYIKARYL